MVSAWTLTFALVVCELVIVFVPGYLVLRASGMRGFMPALAGPPISLALLVGAGIVAHFFAIDWAVWFFALFVALAFALTWAGTRAFHGRARARVLSEAVPHTTSATLIAMLAVIGATVVYTIPLILRWDPTLPSQQIDALFHYNLTWAIAHSGDASLLTGASTTFGLRAISTYYPLAWHMIAALAGGWAATVQAVNALNIVVVAVWFAGIAALSREAFIRDRWAPVAAIAIAFLYPAFPAYLTWERNLWANALGCCLIPATVALFLRMVRMLQLHERFGLRPVVSCLALFGVAFAGTVATYPASLPSVFVLLAPLFGAVYVYVAALVGRRWGRWWRRALHATVAVSLVLGPVIISAVLASPLAFFFRPSFAGFSNPWGRVLALVTLWPAGAGLPWMHVAAALGGAVTLIGVVLAWPRPTKRWIVYGWGLASALLAACYFPLGPLTALTGLWYNDPYRVFPLVIVMLSLFPGVILARWPLRRWAGPVLVALVLVAALLSHGARFFAANQGYDQPGVKPVSFASQEQLRMIAKLRNKLEPGLLVLGDPGNGTAFFQAVANQPVVFPHFTYRGIDTDALFLARHFNEIDRDPRVCQIIRHYGIGYFYDAPPGRVPGVNLLGRSPGFYNTDTSQPGFELVAEAGDAHLYRITRCGELRPYPHLWNLEMPWEPLYDKYGDPSVFLLDGRVDPDSARK